MPAERRGGTCGVAYIAAPSARMKCAQRLLLLTILLACGLSGYVYYGTGILSSNRSAQIRSRGRRHWCSVRRRSLPRSFPAAAAAAVAAANFYRIFAATTAAIIAVALIINILTTANTGAAPRPLPPGKQSTRPIASSQNRNACAAAGAQYPWSNNSSRPKQLRRQSSTSSCSFSPHSRRTSTHPVGPKAYSILPSDGKPYGGAGRTICRIWAL